jgi:hypothetical protein
MRKELNFHQTARRANERSIREAVDLNMTNGLSLACVRHIVNLKFQLELGKPRWRWQAA